MFIKPNCIFKIPLTLSNFHLFVDNLAGKHGTIRFSNGDTTKVPSAMVLVYFHHYNQNYTQLYIIIKIQDNYI